MFPELGILPAFVEDIIDETARAVGKVHEFVGGGIGSVDQRLAHIEQVHQDLFPFLVVRPHVHGKAACAFPLGFGIGHDQGGLPGIILADEFRRFGAQAFGDGGRGVRAGVRRGSDDGIRAGD